MNAIKHLYNGLINMFFPPLCPGCRNHWIERKEPVCLRCELRLEIVFETYDMYAYRLENQNYEPKHVLLLAHYNETMKNLTWAFKYGNQPVVAYYLGYLLGQQIQHSKYKDMFDVIIPVPLHRHKFLTRGYNQALYLAQGIAQSTSIPVLRRALKRVKNTSTQTRKSLEDRVKNVSGAFEYVGEPMYDKHILLVDDVLTTGSTLNFCAEQIELKCHNCDISYGALGLA